MESPAENGDRNNPPDPAHPAARKPLPARARDRARQLRRQAGRLLRAPAIQTLPLAALLVPLAAIAAAGFTLLFEHSDTEMPMLYSQCRSYERLPPLSRGLPGLGVPACFLISFFQEVLASWRTFAVLAAVLSFVAALVTVTLVEAARVCNAPSRLVIARPTGAWLLVNLIGGALVWQLVIVPAFFRRHKRILARRAAAQAGPVLTGGAMDPDLGDAMRHLASASEVVAIPAAVAVGFVLPSVLMLWLDEPVSIGVWLFFPIYVSLVRRIVRAAIARLPSIRRALLHVFVSSGRDTRAGIIDSNNNRAEGVGILSTSYGIDADDDATLHLESHPLALAAVYGLPVVLSALSHALLIWNLASQPDDRRQLTRSAVVFVEVDALFITVTTLYWLLVEAGWRPVLLMMAVSVPFGPGAGLCAAWVLRERVVAPAGVIACAAQDARDRREHDHEYDATDAGEETPLLR